MNGWLRQSSLVPFSALIVFLAVLVTALFVTEGHADEVRGLYEAEISVTTQDPEERRAAITAGLRQILVRVSGSNIALTVTGIEDALRYPTRYVQQFRYRTQPPQAEGEVRQSLWVRFDKDAVNRLLRENRMPVWGKTRPAVLLWLVVDNRKTRVLLGNNTVHSARDFIADQARLRGLPLRLPLLDLADRSSLSVSDVWGNFEDSILRAAQRYQTEAVLVGRVYEGYSGTWNARWTLYNSGRRNDWEVEGATMVEALIPGIDQSANTLAQRFAQVEDKESEGAVLVQIFGVEKLSSYNKALKYLSSLSVVSDVQPYAVSPDNVIYQLTSRSGRLAVSQAIALGHRLVAHVPETTPQPAMGQNPVMPGSENNKPDLVYRLIP